jgi:hypothetical protein
MFPTDEPILSPGVGARYLWPGDERIFILNWSRFAYSDGWGEYGWRGDALNGLWGLDRDAGIVYPAGSSQAKELAQSDVASVNIVDWSTMEISMKDFLQLVAAARRRPPGSSQSKDQ